jgi:hypothetical protein
MILRARRVYYWYGFQPNATFLTNRASLQADSFTPLPILFYTVAASTSRLFASLHVFLSHPTMANIQKPAASELEGNAAMIAALRWPLRFLPEPEGH